jgi:hypothetical protein
MLAHFEQINNHQLLNKDSVQEINYNNNIHFSSSDNSGNQCYKFFPTFRNVK